MSLITRCPACATMFKVVPDQLRVSEGWVRCGQCSEVFDANANLQASAGAEPGQSPAHVLPQQEVPPTPTEAPAEARVEPDALDDPELESETAPEEVEASEPVAEPFLAVNPHALHIDHLEIADAPVEPTLEPQDLEDGVAAATDAQQPPDEDPPPEEEAVLHHTFLQPRATPKATGRRSVRIAWMMASVLLGAALLVQILVQERDRIVAMEPAARDVLSPLCELLGCRIAPLKQIESVVIDSSSFTKVRPDVYRLGFTLKNTSHTALATPALELTLTDLQDQPVVRKVFAAADFGDKGGVMEAGAELPVNLPVAIKLGGNAEKISGYRLLSFYP